MKKIKREQYFKNLLGESYVECKAHNRKGKFCWKCNKINKPIIKRALDYSHDIRKFEIDLYWKRAIYFWGFALTLFGGYILIMNQEASECCDFISASDGKDVYLSGIALTGLLTSFAWHHVEKGSKTHMQNWEYHIDFLENEISGHLYKMNLGKKKEFFSLSKVNSSIIWFIGALWFLFFAIPSKGYFIALLETESSFLMPAALFAAIFLIFAFLRLRNYWRTSNKTIPEHCIISSEEMDLYRREYDD